MTTQRIVLPYRRGPNHIPRRDLALAAADSLALEVAIVEYDDPSAPALDLSGGIGGPGAQLTIWADAPGRFYDDYGTMLPVSGQVLWMGTGTISACVGSFYFSFPSGTMASWPRRCRWCVQLNYDTQGAEVLMSGQLHVRMLGMTFGQATPTLQTDDFIPIHTDIEEQVLA